MNHIYLDLDGVLVNLEESFYNYYPNKPSHQTWQEYEKQNISKSMNSVKQRENQLKSIIIRKQNKLNDI